MNNDQMFSTETTNDHLHWILINLIPRSTYYLFWEYLYSLEGFGYNDILSYQNQLHLHRFYLP